MQPLEYKQKIILRTTLILLFLVLILSSFPFFSRLLLPHLFPYDAKRVIELGLLSLLALFITVARPFRLQLLDLWQALPKLARLGLIVFLLLGLLSGQVNAIRPQLAYLEVCLYALLFVTLALGLGSNFKQNPMHSSRGLLILLYLFALFYNIFYFALLIKLTWLSHLGNAFYISGFFPGFMNIRFFMQMQIWTLPILSLPLLCPINRVAKYFLGLVAACWWSLLFINNSRGALLALLIALVIIACIYRAQAKRYLLTTLMLMAAGYVIYVVLYAAHLGVWLNMFSSLSHGTYVDRTVMWHYAWLLTQQHPWLGVGPMHYAYQAIPTAAGFKYHGHPHNIFFLILSEWGIPATVIFFGLWIWGAVAWAKRFSNKAVTKLKPCQMNLALTLKTALVSGVLYAFVTGMLVMPLAQIFTGVFAGWAMGYYFSFDKKEVPTANRCKEIILILVLVVACLYSWWVIAPQLHLLANHEMAWMGIAHFQAFAPRFWLQGIIS